MIFVELAELNLANCLLPPNRDPKPAAKITNIVIN
jgi:hypothetical protein